MRIVPILFFTILIALSVVALHGETQLNTLEEIALYGSEHNLSYQSSQIGVLEAEGDLVGVFKWENTSIDIDAGYDESDSYRWDFSSTLTVPIIEQISLEGEIEEDTSGKIGFILSPLEHSSDKILSEINYDSALLNAEDVRLSSENSAVSAALNWMIAYRYFESQKTLASIKEINYNDDKVRYELGEVSLDELQVSLIEWSEARVELSDKTKTYQASKSSLLGELGSGREDVTIKKLSLEELKNSLLRIQESLEPESGNPLKNNNYQISLLNVNSARATDKNTWVYEPDLELSTYLDFDGDGDVTFSADLSLTLSLDQVQLRESRIKEMELEISLKEAEQSRNEAELEFQQIVDSISSTEINSEIALLELEQATILLSEAELLERLGEYSSIELEEMNVTFFIAENSYFESLANEYEAWLALKEYL